MMLQRISSLLGVAAVAVATAASVAAAQQPATAPDSGAIVGTVDRFHRALASGDSLGALALLTENVVVLESGGFETRAEFRNHHLPADIDFARSTTGERTVRSVAQRGDVAWVAATSTAAGIFRGRTVSSAGAELMVLIRTPAGWRISAIHWSSRRRQ